MMPVRREHFGYGSHSREPFGAAHRGFTLVELVITLAIIAMLSTIAAFSVTGTLHRYHLTRATETLERFDQMARRIARTNESTTVGTIDRKQRKLFIEVPGQPATKHYTISNRVEISELRLPRKRIAGGPFKQIYNLDGRTRTLAVQLSIGKMKRWVVLLGNSGQAFSTHDDRQVNELLSL